MMRGIRCFFQAKGLWLPLFVAACLFWGTQAGVARTGVEMITKKTDRVDISIACPESLGNPRIDADIRAWAEQVGEDFMQAYAEEPSPEGVPFELRLSFELSRPSKRAVSVTWERASYTGGAHGNLDILVRSYDLQTGEPIDLLDLFGDLEIALERMSVWSCKALSESLGDMLEDDMLRGGTTPDAENFYSIALIPSGVRVHFQPYQVAPWAAGPQSVEIPLEELMDASPRLELWGR